MRKFPLGNLASEGGYSALSWELCEFAQYQTGCGKLVFVVAFLTKGLVFRVFGKQVHKKHYVCVCVCVCVCVLGAMQLWEAGP